MNYRKFCVYDMETSSPDPSRTQPVQLAALMIDGRRLEVIEGSEFQSLIQPSFDEEFCEEHGLDLLQPGAVKVHGKTEEMLKKAPKLKEVWGNFTEYVQSYQYKKGEWHAPISTGYNIKGFDNPITERICTKEPWGFGPSNKRGRATIFNPIHSIDMLDIMFLFFENNKDVNSLSADNLIRGYMGASSENAHDAMTDVRQCAELFCKMMRLIRAVAGKTKLKGSLAGVV